MAVHEQQSQRLLREFFDHMKRSNRSQQTVYQYARDLVPFAEQLGKPLTAATYRDLAAWLDRPRRHVLVAAPATIKREVSELRALYAFLTDQLGAIPRNPALKLNPPKVHNESPHPVPEELWLQVWFSTMSDDLRVALGLGYFCGLRRHEILLLRAAHFEGPWLRRVKRKGGKRAGFPWRSCVQLYSERLERLIGDADEFFMRPLERLLEVRAQEPALLPWDDEKSRRHNTRGEPRPAGMIDPNQMNRRMSDLARRFDAGRFAPHDLRHSFCTNLVRKPSRGAGLPVEVASRLAGHASLDVTMRYVHLDEDPLREYLAQGSASDLVGLGRWDRAQELVSERA